MSWFSLNPTSKNFSKNCAQTSTPKAPTTPPTPSPSAPSPPASASASPSSAIPKTIPPARFSTPSARLRMSEPRFLVVRLGSLGDIVHTFPAVAGLRNSFPRAELIWLTHPRWVNLVASSGLASEIWPVDSRDLANVSQTIAKIRAQNWSASIDYQGLWKSALLPFLAGVPKRVGFSSEAIREFGVPILYTDRIDPHSAHIADQNGELSLRVGAQNAVGLVELRVDESDRLRVKSVLAAAGIDRYVVLSPGGGWRSKCWPAQRFGELSQEIREELNLPCVINYGPGEETLAAAVKSASGHADPFLYNGELGPLMALLQGAKCIVGGDTGPLHLAI